MKPRKVIQITPGRPASDGAGVKLTRLIGQQGLSALDPFLMLDEFNSDKADDYMAGFPSHPHRGFETVTYMLEGNMLHEDHLGNRGLLQSGDVQWMTAARGIIHSEMPQQVEGRMRGFQLWINLPSSEKMKTPSYRDISSTDIPTYQGSDFWVKVIAGEFQYGDISVVGAVNGISTQPLYFDLALDEGSYVQLPTDQDHTLLIYVYEGVASVAGQQVHSQQLAQTSNGNIIHLTSKSGARMLVLAGKPLREPIAHWGPFVMNTQEEIEQAIQDYRDGILTQ